MDESILHQLKAAYGLVPESMKSEIATELELSSFESRYGTIPADYRWFLLHCGGGIVGSERIDGIVELKLTHEKFHLESSMPGGWTMGDVFVIGWDGAGNPFGIEKDTGKVVVEDHNFGGIHVLAPSFEKLLSQNLLQ